MTDPFVALERYVDTMRPVTFNDFPMIPTVELPESLRNQRGKVVDQEGEFKADQYSFSWRLTAAVDSVGFRVKFSSEFSTGCMNILCRKISRHAKSKILRKVPADGYHLSFLYDPGMSAIEAVESTRLIISQCFVAQKEVGLAAEKFITSLAT